MKHTRSGTVFEFKHLLWARSTLLYLSTIHGPYWSVVLNKESRHIVINLIPHTNSYSNLAGKNKILEDEVIFKDFYCSVQGGIFFRKTLKTISFFIV